MSQRFIVLTATLCYYYYYAAFNGPCIGHKDDKSQVQMTNHCDWPNSFARSTDVAIWYTCHMFPRIQKVFQKMSHLSCHTNISSKKWHKHEHSRVTALCPGLPGWAGTRRNIHPLTPIIKKWKHIYFKNHAQTSLCDCCCHLPQVDREVWPTLRSRTAKKQNRTGPWGVSLQTL